MLALVDLVDKHLKKEFPLFTINRSLEHDEVYVNCPCNSHIGFIKDKKVHIFRVGDISAYDLQFFEKLSEALKFTQEYVCR